MTSSRRILIVEDDHDTRVAYRKTLEEEGYAVTSSTNGKSALEVLRKKNSIGLIFLDMNMPIMGGNEFLKIKARDPSIPDIPVVVITSQGENIASPVSAAFQKPIDLLDLIKTAKRYFSVD